MHICIGHRREVILVRRGSGKGADGKKREDAGKYADYKKNKEEKRYLMPVLVKTVRSNVFLSAGLLAAIAGTVVAGILPPLVLEKIVNNLASGTEVLLHTVILYFVLVAVSGIFDAAKESLITLFGQKVTHGLRREMCEKLRRMPAAYFIKNEPGVITSRFVNDVDKVEELFTSGVISMAVDGFKVISVLAVIFVKSKGLGVLMIVVTPLLFWMTRVIQRRMLAAQMENREAVGRANNYVPETIQNIRMIHTFRKENYMEHRYDSAIQDGYRAMEKSNFYDAIYSPIIITTSAVVVAVMMVLSARGGQMQTFFGMSVGAAVAVIAYVTKVFEPLESIGMEIQSIQSAMAGIRRIDEFMAEEERELPEHAETKKRQEAPTGAEKVMQEEDRKTAEKDKLEKDCRMAEQSLKRSVPAVEFENVVFAYEDEKNVLEHCSFQVETGENVTIAGRTGAGKSTIFRLLQGLYEPQQGRVLLHGIPADRVRDEERRKLFGYVEQTFHMVPGSVLDQITLKDPDITEEDALRAAKLVGLKETIEALEKGYDTPCTMSLFSQGQFQLLSIARAIVSEPEILLLDEITANLDSATEGTVLAALRAATANRTVISISHRLYEQSGGRRIDLTEIQEQ